MKTFRNVVAVLGLLLLLYVGSYCLFARKDMLFSYQYAGVSSVDSSYKKSWYKAFVPIASLDFRLTLERPFRNRHAGHWKSAVSTDFVTMARDGEFSFQLGDFKATGMAEVSDDVTCYFADFERNGRDYQFWFEAREKSGTLEGNAELLGFDPMGVIPERIGAVVTLTRAASPD